jgi:hypothetical protein
MSTTSNAYTDVDTSKLVKSNNEKGLVDLESKDLGLDEG